MLVKYMGYYADMAVGFGSYLVSGFLTALASATPVSFGTLSNVLLAIGTVFVGAGVTERFVLGHMKKKVEEESKAEASA